MVSVTVSDENGKPITHLPLNSFSAMVMTCGGIICAYTPVGLGAADVKSLNEDPNGLYILAVQANPKSTGAPIALRVMEPNNFKAQVPGSTSPTDAQRQKAFVLML